MASQRKDRPGYQYRKRSDGSVAHYWNPRRAVSKAPKSLGLRKLDDFLSDEAIALKCQQWTDELLADLEDRKSGASYNGTIDSLVTMYRTDENSPYHDRKYTTRVRDYEPSLKLIVNTVGKRMIANLRGDDFRRWYGEWAAEGKVRRAHGAVRKLRTILSYGVTERLPGCSQAREILSLMRFDAPAVRKQKMEYEHAKAICEKAIELQRPSIAITQAIQWDTALRRIHIIGEWLPVEEGDTGGIIRGNTKWRGPTASDISPDMVLTIPLTSKNKVATRHDLSQCPLVQWVLGKVELPKVGPIVVSEVTGVPWRENYYATEWRKIAKAAGVPENVWSMDSRAGAISEAEEATGSIDAARKMAGHTNTKTTLGYVRNDDLENNRKVAQARSTLRQ